MRRIQKSINFDMDITIKLAAIIGGGIHPAISVMFFNYNFFIWFKLSKRLLHGSKLNKTCFAASATHHRGYRTGCTHGVFTNFLLIFLPKQNLGHPITLYFLAAQREVGHPFMAVAGASGIEQRFEL